MRKTGCALLALALLGGCTSGGGHYGNHPAPHGPRHGGRPNIPGVQGPYGTPVPMIAPYAYKPPNPQMAHAMMSNSMPLNMVQMHAAANRGAPGIRQVGYTPGSGSPLMPAQYQGMPMLTPPGLPASPGMPGGNPMMGRGPSGASQAAFKIGVPPPTGAVAGIGMLTGKSQLRFPTSRTQVRFVQPSGMRVYWFTSGANGKDSYSEIPIEVPGRYNFLQAAVYRLKLTQIPGHPGIELYPTLEVVPANPHTEAFLAHSAVPLSFSPEDFAQVVSGNYVVKVIYLPNPRFQDLAFTAPGEISSTQLEPGADPIKEAQRRGSILMVIRMGNMDQEAPNTPHINKGGAHGAAAGPPPGAMGLPPGQMVPYGMFPKAPMMPPPPGHPNAGSMSRAPGMAPGVPMSRGAVPPGAMPYPPRIPMMQGPAPRMPMMAPGQTQYPTVPKGAMPYPPVPQGAMPYPPVPQGAMPYPPVPRGALPYPPQQGGFPGASPYRPQAGATPGSANSGLRQVAGQQPLPPSPPMSPPTWSRSAYQPAASSALSGGSSCSTGGCKT